MNTLYKDIIDFKRTIESINPKERPIGLQAFPKGACSDASFLLGSYLTRLGYGQFNVVCGKRGSVIENTRTSHAWLKMNELIIDITCNQFEEVTDEIIVSKTSNWHSNFKIDSTEIADVHIRDKGAAVPLSPFFETILNLMNLRDLPP